MPSGVENLDNNRFIIRYEHPWGGISSEASPEDIAPNQLVSSDGMFIRHGRLCSTNFYAFDPDLYKHSIDGTALYMPNSAGIMAMYTVGQNLVAIDGLMNGYIYDFNGMSWMLDQTLQILMPLPYAPLYSCSIMINKIIYIFDYYNMTQYVYIPGVSFIQAVQQDATPQAFVGGKYCMTVDHYLITANTNMSTDSPTNKANRYNWSAAPDGYTTFDPNADPALTPGYNTLPEVQQEITGCFAMGNVGYIIHDQGVTQLTPTGTSALLPFDSTLLWGGKDGIGCTMPDTLAVYGYMAIWGNNNDFYMFSAGNAPQPICGIARRAIYRDINMFKYKDSRYFDVHANIINVGVDNLSPNLVYNIYITYSSPASSIPINMIVWSFAMGTGTWTRHVLDVTDAMRKITGNPDYSGVMTLDYDATIASTFKFPSNASIANDQWFISSLYGGMIFNVMNGTQLDSFFLFQYVNSDGLSSLPDIPPITNLTFRTEEFQIYRLPTVRGVILRAAGMGTLHIKVNDSDFTDIEVNSQGSPTLYRSFGVYTNMHPRINISSTNFNGLISKVHAFGTYAEGEPI
jgi:hypothetical protein